MSDDHVGTPVPSGRPAVADPFTSIDADLALVDELPIAEQVVVFDRLNSSLTAALAETSDERRPGVGTGR